MAREKYMLEEGMKLGVKKGIKEGIKKGVEQGIKKGVEQEIKKGIKEGEIKKAIEAVVNLVLATKMPTDEAMKILKVDSSYKKQIEIALKEQEI